MLKYIPDYVEKIVAETVNTDAMPEKWDEEALNAALQQKVYPDECEFVITREMLERWDYERAIGKISKEVIKAYEKKIENIFEMTEGQVDYRQIERNELLRSVDRNWIDHIDAMDQLRKGIGLRGYAQQDPVIAYKQEGYEMFEEMIERVQTTTISRLLKGRVVRVPAPQSMRQMPAQPAEQPSATDNPPANGGISPINPSVAARAQQIAEQRAAEAAANGGNAQPSQTEQNGNGLTSSAAVTSSAAQTRPSNSGAPVIGAAPQSPAGLMTNIGGKQNPRVAPKSAKVGRNDPCPCGSGKKYKDCCYWKDHK